MLSGYEGMVTSDSFSPWNHGGREHQKCHLHYKSELKKAIQDNENPEFQAFAAKLSQILCDSHDPKRATALTTTPKPRSESSAA